MNVSRCMTTDVVVCHPNNNSEEVALIMYQLDRKSLPVINENKEVLGMISVRDICMYAAKKHIAMWSIPISDIIRHKKWLVAKDNDTADSALNLIVKNQLDSLAIINNQQQLVGIVSLIDLVPHNNKKSYSQSQLYSSMPTKGNNISEFGNYYKLQTAN